MDPRFLVGGGGTKIQVSVDLDIKVTNLLKLFLVKFKFLCRSRSQGQKLTQVDSMDFFYAKCQLDCKRLFYALFSIIPYEIIMFKPSIYYNSLISL